MKQTAVWIIFGALMLPVLAWAAKPLPADRDRDGVPDFKDICPYTQANLKVDAQGCALDDDFDGIANGRDRCPASTFGAPVNAEGCSRAQRAAKTTIPASPMPPLPPVAAEASANISLPSTAFPESDLKAEKEVELTPQVSTISKPETPVIESDRPMDSATRQQTIDSASAQTELLTQDAGNPAPPPAELQQPSLSDENTLLDAINRRDQARELAEERENQQRLSRLLEAPYISNDAQEHTADKPAPVLPRSTPHSAVAAAASTAAAVSPARTPKRAHSGDTQHNTERLLAYVPFAEGKAEIKDDPLKNLAQVTSDLARTMQRLPTLRVEVVGYADAASEGNRAMKLAADRALTVNAYLIAHGVPAGRIKRINHHDQDPVADSGSAGRQVAEIYTYPR